MIVMKKTKCVRLFFKYIYTHIYIGLTKFLFYKFLFYSYGFVLHPICLQYVKYYIDIIMQ